MSMQKGLSQKLGNSFELVKLTVPIKVEVEPEVYRHLRN